MSLYKTLDPATVKEIEKIDELNWMYQSRSFLDTVYSFNNTNKNNHLDQQYITMSSKIIKMQLVKAGIRLASILRTCLKQEAPVEAFRQYQLMMRVLLS